MSFSGTNIIEIVAKETPYELFIWNFDNLIFVEVCACQIFLHYQQKEAWKIKGAPLDFEVLGLVKILTDITQEL